MLPNWLKSWLHPKQQAKYIQIKEKSTSKTTSKEYRKQISEAFFSPGPFYVLWLCEIFSPPMPPFKSTNLPVNPFCSCFCTFLLPVPSIDRKVTFEKCPIDLFEQSLFILFTEHNKVLLLHMWAWNGSNFLFVVFLPKYLIMLFQC